MWVTQCAQANRLEETRGGLWPYKRSPNAIGAASGHDISDVTRTYRANHGLAVEPVG